MREILGLVLACAIGVVLIVTVISGCTGKHDPCDDPGAGQVQGC